MFSIVKNETITLILLFDINESGFSYLGQMSKAINSYKMTSHKVISVTLMVGKMLIHSKFLNKYKLVEQLRILSRAK